MRVEPDRDAVKPSTILGDWYANLLHTPQGQLILCVSEKTLLPILLPAVDTKSVATRLSAGVASLLATLGISSGQIEKELLEMSQVAIGKTANRSVTGSMVDFAWLAEAGLGRGESLQSVVMFLTRTPCTPLREGRRPRDATIAAFSAALG